MNGCVNIADFRCRAIKFRSQHDSPRNAIRSCTLTVVESNPTHESLFRVVSSNPIDIGVAREAQRMRHRSIFRPISIQRHAKVIRFNEAPARVAAMRVAVGAEQGRRAETWQDGPLDFPPAA
jgi:hypothetical protein